MNSKRKFSLIFIFVSILVKALKTNFLNDILFWLQKKIFIQQIIRINEKIIDIQ